MRDECCAVPATATPAAATGAVRLRDVGALRAALLSGSLLAAGFIARRFVPGAWGELAYVPALLVGASTFVPSALRTMARRRLNVGVLMTIAAVGAVLLRQIGEAASLAFLFSISEGLETYALARTRHGLRALLSLVPATATVRRGGELTISSAELAVGDLMIVRPGERLATDGVIRAGRSAMDLSAITGESMPVERNPGDDIEE